MHFSVYRSHAYIPIALPTAITHVTSLPYSFCVWWCVCSLLVTFGQQRLIELALSDAPTNERGHIIATIVSREGIAYTGPVCGEVDLHTAWITCINLGWLFTTETSTTSGFGWADGVTMKCGVHNSTRIIRCCDFIIIVALILANILIASYFCDWYRAKIYSKATHVACNLHAAPFYWAYRNSKYW